MPIETSPELLSFADLAPQAHVDATTVIDDGIGLSYLNADERAGANVNGAISLSGIPNGRCNQVTFSVSGAQVGDTPIVTTRAAIQNGIVLIAARVASAGHVEVNACNFSGLSRTTGTAPSAVIR